jgi:hypothetical protein
LELLRSYAGTQQETIKRQREDRDDGPALWHGEIGDGIKSGKREGEERGA